MREEKGCKSVESLDVNVEAIEISIRADGKVVWVNGPNGLLLRVNGVKHIHIDDKRNGI